MGSDFAPSALEGSNLLRKKSASYVGICHELLQFFFGDNFAVEQMYFPLRVLREARIVRHHTDCCPFAMKVGQEFHHSFAVARIQVSCGFVGEQDGWLSA